MPQKGRAVSVEGYTEPGRTTHTLLQTLEHQPDATRSRPSKRHPSDAITMCQLFQLSTQLEEQQLEPDRRHTPLVSDELEETHIFRSLPETLTDLAHERCLARSPAVMGR
jgi:hypothetical protein